MTETQKELYVKTKERLRRLEKEKPADVIVALAEECKHYRKRISELENAPHSFADEGFDGVYCEECATALGYTPGKRRRPPNTGSNAQPPKPRPETVWAYNLEALKAFALGDPKDPETMLRYWKAQEAADYPGASENVKYFMELIGNKEAEV